MTSNCYQKDSISSNAQRIRRRRERQAAQGVKQINVLAPAEVHGVIREIADKTRSGTPLATVIGQVAASLAANAGGDAARSSEGYASPQTQVEQSQLVVGFGARARKSLRWLIRKER